MRKSVSHYNLSPVIEELAGSPDFVRFAMASGQLEDAVVNSPHFDALLADVLEDDSVSPDRIYDIFTAEAGEDRTIALANTGLDILSDYINDEKSSSANVRRAALAGEIISIMEVYKERLGETQRTKANSIAALNFFNAYDTDDFSFYPQILETYLSDASGEEKISFGFAALERLRAAVASGNSDLASAIQSNDYWSDAYVLGPVFTAAISVPGGEKLLEELCSEPTVSLFSIGKVAADSKVTNPKTLTNIMDILGPYAGEMFALGLLTRDLDHKATEFANLIASSYPFDSDLHFAAIYHLAATSPNFGSDEVNPDEQDRINGNAIAYLKKGKFSECSDDDEDFFFSMSDLVKESARILPLDQMSYVFGRVEGNWELAEILDTLNGRIKEEKIKGSRDMDSLWDAVAKKMEGNNWPHRAANFGTILINRGNLTVPKVKEIAASSSLPVFIRDAAKSHLASLSASDAAPAPEAQKQTKKVSEVRPQSLRPGASFAEYVRACQPKHTAVAALGLYCTDTRIAMESREVARNDFTSLLSAMPDLADEVPAEVWAGLNKVRGGLPISADLALKLQSLGESARKFGSKHLIRAAF